MLRLSSLREKLKYPMEDNIKNHLLTYVMARRGLAGSITEQGFKVWNFNLWRGAFYPIIEGKLIKNGSRMEINLKARMNPMAKLISLMGSLLWIFILVDTIVIQEINAWTFLWRRFLVAMFIASIPYIAFGMVLRYEYRLERERIAKLIQKDL